MQVPERALASRDGTSLGEALSPADVDGLVLRFGSRGQPVGTIWTTVS
jgi:hypothetical protein